MDTANATNTSMDNDETTKYLTVILYTYVVRIVCIVGIFGNVAILVVLSRRGAKETAFVYIRALAAMDLIVCICLLGLGNVRGGDCRVGYWGRVFEAFIYLPFANAGQTANLFITICMAIHCVVSVMQIRKASHHGYALRINVHRSRKLARRLVVIILLLSGAINSVRFFFHTVVEVDQTEESSLRKERLPVTLPALSLPTSSRLGVISAGDGDILEDPATLLGLLQRRNHEFAFNVPSATVTEEYKISAIAADVYYELRKTDFFKQVETSFLYGLSALHFGELFILTTVNLVLIRILRSSQQQRMALIPNELQQHKRRDGDDVALALIITVFVHIVCHGLSPFSIPPMAQLFFGSPYVLTSSYRLQLAINNTLTLTSHAITFFLYLVSRKFRKQVRRTWDCVIHHLFKTRRALQSPTPNHSWTPSYLKGGTSPILHRHQSSVPIRFL